jgi:hypothetical protein
MSSTAAGWQVAVHEECADFISLHFHQDPVSILSTPHFRSPALMPCTHPHTKSRFVLVLSCTRSLALYSCSLSQEYIGARRPRSEAADCLRHHTEYFYHCLCELREPRGRRGARDASVDAALRVRCCGQASAQLEHSSLGGSAAASAAASAAPPSVAAGRAAQLKTGAVG